MNAASDDVQVFEEPDERFWVGVGLTRSEKFLVIEASSKITSEVRVIPADTPEAEPTLIAPREHGVEYSIEHHGHRFLILHNKDAEDFALAYTSADSPGDWVELQLALDPLYARVAETYADARPGELIVYEDSFGALAIAVRDGNAARLTGAAAGERVRIRVTSEPA